MMKRTLTNSLPAFSDRLQLGASELMVSPFCIGIVQSAEAVLLAYERGINFFFVTCDMHWPKYESLRRGLKELLCKRGLRDQIVVAGVCYPTQPEFCTRPFEELLEAVPNLKYI